MVQLPFKSSFAYTSFAFTYNIYDGYYGGNRIFPGVRPDLSYDTTYKLRHAWGTKHRNAVLRGVLPEL